MDKKYLYLLTLAFACSTFAQGVLTPIYAFFVQRIGGGILEISWAIAVYSIITGIGTILIHRTLWSHTYRRHLLWGGWLLWLLSITTYYIMVNTTMLYMAELFNGIGSAMCQPIFNAEFSENTSSDLTGGWALYEGVTNIFYGLASICGGLVATFFGFTALIHCMFCVSAFSFCLISYYTHANFKGSTAQAKQPQAQSSP